MNDCRFRLAYPKTKELLSFIIASEFCLGPAEWIIVLPSRTRSIGSVGSHPGVSARTAASPDIPVGVPFCSILVRDHPRIKFMHFLCASTFFAFAIEIRI